MTQIQARPTPGPVSSPAPATRPLLDLVSRFQNRLEDGDRPGHKLLSAGLAPGGQEREALEARRDHLRRSLDPTPDSLRSVVAALLGAFPTYGASREDAAATVALVCRALNDVPTWAVQKAAANFLRGTTRITWAPDRAPTPPQIRAEAKMLMLDVETELHRLSQVLDAEIVDADTTEDERRQAVARWHEVRAGIKKSNMIGQQTADEIARDRAEQLRANERIRAREAASRSGADAPA